MHILKASYRGNPNIGLFCYATDSYCLVPLAMDEKQRGEIGKILQVPVYGVKAAGTDLLGVFFAGNDDTLLVPSIMFDTELDMLKAHGITYNVVDTKLTALGNNMFIHGKKALINEEYEGKALKTIEQHFAVKKGKLGELDIPGSLAVANGRGMLVSPETKDFERKFLKSTFKTAVLDGTVNFGSPYVSSGIVCNDKGFLVGSMSSGPEIQQIDEALGFLE